MLTLSIDNQNWANGGTADIVDFIRNKASRNTPLQNWNKRFSALVAKVRFKVEQSYGTMKRAFYFNRARYFGRLKMEAQMVWAAVRFDRSRGAKEPLNSC